MLKPIESGAYRRDIKRIRRTHNLAKLEQVVKMLALGVPLEPRLQDHPLTGNWKGYRDCHVEPDWILIYEVTEDTVNLSRTGTHSDLF